ncbi:DNA repair protein Rad60 [Anastrepha obliqua]|uniref:DNA repair protein Rad60 n=1 Tax=Anastrepha obliqua TaxID=95512 RepID=UPI002409383E|nr:DNA repair protein Rad60 [Anastrepha obliqua]
MSQDYDVFADLYDNDKDDNAKVLETLTYRNAALLKNDSSDEDDFLVPSKQNKGKGRGKKAGSTSNKECAVAKALSPTKKSRKSQSEPDKDAFQKSAEEQSTHSNACEPMARRRTSRRSAAVSSEITTDSTPSTTVTSAPARGRKGRRGRNSREINVPTVESIDTMVIAAVMSRGVSGPRRNVMRARRACLSEIAARATNVDYMDLVSSPIPHIEGVITLDSDGEDSISNNNVQSSGTETPNTSNAATLDCSFDEDNPEISVKIKWEGGRPEIFQLRRHQKFHNIFSEIADRENKSINNIVFNIDNRIIAPNDTPASISYKVYEFISGRELTESFEVGTVRKKRDANVITLKIQSDLWPKRPLKVELNKLDKLKILYIKCAEELKMSAEDLVLSFNGDQLGFNDTPDDFEFEGDEAIDLRVKKK